MGITGACASPCCRCCFIRCRPRGPSSPMSTPLIAVPHTPSTSCSTGTLEFSIKSARGTSVDSFFPVRTTFTSNDTLCPIAVTDVVSVDEGRTLRHAVTKGLQVEEYAVE